MAATENLPRQRLQARNVLRKALMSHDKFAAMKPENLDAVIRRIERDCYNEVILQCKQEFVDATWQNMAFLGRYQSLIYKYSINLDVRSSLESSYLGDQIVAGGIKPEEITRYTSKDINPDASASERATIELRQQQKIEKKSTDRYQCNKCFARRATVEEVQHKRVDDGGTNRIVCLECSNVWFKNGV